VFGGYSYNRENQFEMSDSIEKYNFELNMWSILNDIKCPRKISNPICFTFND